MIYRGNKIKKLPELSRSFLSKIVGMTGFSLQAGRKHSFLPSNPSGLFRVLSKIVGMTGFSLRAGRKHSFLPSNPDGLFRVLCKNSRDDRI